MASIADAGGPMKRMLASSVFFTNPAFSLRNPYPCRVSVSEWHNEVKIGEIREMYHFLVLVHVPNKGIL